MAKIATKIRFFVYKIKVLFGLTFLGWNKVDNFYDYGHFVDDDIEYVRMDENGEIHKELKIVSMDQKINTINKILRQINKNQ